MDRRMDRKYFVITWINRWCIQYLPHTGGNSFLPPVATAILSCAAMAIKSSSTAALFRGARGVDVYSLGGRGGRLGGRGGRRPPTLHISVMWALAFVLEVCPGDSRRGGRGFFDRLAAAAGWFMATLMARLLITAGILWFRSIPVTVGYFLQ
jgi:hypothetical protein